MSRQVSTANGYMRDYRCSITLGYPLIDPVMVNPCGHLFDKKAFYVYLQRNGDSSCPCCRSGIGFYGDAPSIIKNTLSRELSQNPELYKEVNFDADHFADIVRKNEFNTPIGERFITLLQNENAANHLNDIAIEGTQHGKSAIEILASTEASRELLRKYFNIKIVEGKEQYRFGETEISAESLKIQVNGKSIQAWLYPTTDLVIQEEGVRAKIVAEEISAFNVFIKSKFRLFSPAGDHTNLRLSCGAVNDILQQVVYGQRAKVREMLDKMKRENPALLKEVLTSVATQPIYDYSGKKIEDVKLLEAAAAANAVAIHPELAADPEHQDMCEIIQSYFDSTDQTDQTEITVQYKYILERNLQQYLEKQQIELVHLNALKAAGKTVDDECVKDIATRIEQYKAVIDSDNIQLLFEGHKKAQEENTFDFSKVIDAITHAGVRAQTSGARDEVYAALYNYRGEGASFTETDAARAKSDDQLTLMEALNRFREQFEKQALKEVIINPHHLLKILQNYNAQYDSWNDDQRRLFLRQFGFAQRYSSAPDARVFAYSLIDAVDNKRKVPDHFDFRFDSSYLFYPAARSCSGLGFDYWCCLSLGGFVPSMSWPPVQTCWRPSLTQLISNKNIGLEKLMRPAKSHQPRACSVM